MRTRSRWVRTWIAISIIGGVVVVRSTVKLVAKPPSLLGLIAVLSSLRLARASACCTCRSQAARLDPQAATSSVAPLESDRCGQEPSPLRYAS